jgi:RNA polymerase sigma-70 factor (ECF subfamily)
MPKQKKITDLQLIKAFNKGSTDAFEEILSRYQVKAFNLAMRFVKNQEDAEEVLQDVFTTLYRKLHAFEGKSAFSSWLYRIVVNASFMKLRKKRQTPTSHLEDLSPLVQTTVLEREEMMPEKTDTFTVSREIRESLQLAIGKLPDEYRSVFVLRDVDGLSNQEVGEILSLTVPAVKSRLHRSRLMLRKKLVRFYEEFYGMKYVPTDDMNLDSFDEL